MEAILAHETRRVKYETTKKLGRPRKRLPSEESVPVSVVASSGSAKSLWSY
jgi:hypothetical protein